MQGTVNISYTSNEHLLGVATWLV